MRLHQAAADALMDIIAKLGQFRGESRFTTWAYKFVIFEVSAKVGRHYWRHLGAAMAAEDWDRLPDRFGLDYSLPLQLCDLAWIAAVIALLTRRWWAVALTYYWGLVLSTQALVTPALNGPDFPSLEFTAFWSIHILVVWAAIYLTWGRGMRPTWRSYGFAAVVTLAWAGFTFTFNRIAGTNYGFLNGKSPQECVDLGVAHGALLMTTRGDSSQITLEELLHTAGGGSARIKR